METSLAQSTLPEPAQALSPTMERAVIFIRQHKNMIHRFPGGYWAQENWKHDGPHFGTTTIEALVWRGVLYYTAFQSHKTGQFPIRAELTTAWRNV